MSESVWNRNGGLYLGYPSDRTEGDPPAPSRPFRYTGDRHMFLAGPTRSGKTKRILTPILAETVHWTVVVNDPKGELCAMTSEHRRAAGSEIVILNPYNVLGLGSTGFNPVAALELDDEFPNNALELAEAIIRIEGNEPHWCQAAQEYLAGLMMYVRLVMPEGSLEDVRALAALNDAGTRRLIQGGGNTDPRQYRLFEEQADDVPKGYEPPFRYKNRLYPGIIAAADHYGWPQIRNKVERFSSINPDNKELHSVLGTALTQTRWLDSIRVANDLKGPAYDFSVMRDKPVTVYMILPAHRLATHSAWIRLMVSSMVQKLMVDTSRSKVPILFALDEYAALAGGSSYGANENGDGFPIIARNMPMFAGYNIKLLTIWQDLAQAKRIYGDGFESFLGNAGVTQIFAPRDITTSDYFSKMTGQRTVPVVTQGQNRSQQPGAPMGTAVSDSTSQHFIPMPLMLAQTIRNMDIGFALIFSDRAKGPVRCYVPWPGDIPHLQSVMARDPSR
jgi:type IV secretion system protein VirD4